MRPSDRDVRIAAGVLLSAGLGACAVAIFSEQLGLGAEVARGTFGWKRTGLLVAGGLVFAVGALLMARPQIVPWADRSQALHGYVQSLSGHLAIGLLVLLGVVLAWTRLIHIDHSLWHDEAFTVVNFSGVGPQTILLGESFSINNHVAYNFLSWVTVSLLGESEAMYRLWSVLPGMAAIGAGVWWAWRRIGRVAAVAFATIAVAAPLHLEYIPQARGYGLTLLGATLMLIVADRLISTYSKRTLLGFVAAGLLGIWTLFTFTIVFVGQALALLRWRHLRVPVLVAVGAAGILSLLFYAPMLGAIAERTSGRESGTAIPLSAALLLDRPLEWLVIPTVTMLTGDGGRAPLDGSGVTAAAPWATWLDITVLAVYALGLVALWRRGDGGLALLLVAPPLFFNLALSLGNEPTVTRHQLFLLPYIVVPVATGIGELGRIIAQHRSVRPLVIGVGVVAVIALSGAIVQKEERRELPRENFQQVANVVHRTGIATVVTDSLRPHGLRYYLGDGLEELPLEWIESLLCEGRQEIVYIHHLAYSNPYWDPARLDCMAGKASVRVRVPQRARGRAIDVWIVDPRASRETVKDDLSYARQP